MSDTKISEAAVEAAEVAFSGKEGWPSDMQMRAALEAALPHLHPQPAELAFDVGAMLTACVPGGSIVDPQVVADNIRAWFADQKPAELAEQQIQPVNADEAPFGLTTAEKVAWARGANDAIKEYALAATGKQQVGEVQDKEVQPVAHSDSQWIK